MEIIHTSLVQNQPHSDSHTSMLPNLFLAIFVPAKRLPSGFITFQINDILNQRNNKRNENPFQFTVPKKDSILNLLNPVYTTSTLLLASRSYSRTQVTWGHTAPTKIAWTVFRGPRSFLKVLDGTVMNITPAKDNEDSVTVRQNFSRSSLKVTFHQPLKTTVQVSFWHFRVKQNWPLSLHN